MYILVVGGGKVGYHLSRELLGEGHEVLIIEKDQKKVDRITDELGSICHRGDGCEASVLEEVGAGRADMLIAVTGDDEDNLVSCQVAKIRFNVRRTIARINNPKNDRVFRLLGIDATVSSTSVILEHIEHEVPDHALMHLMDLNRLGIELVDITIPEVSPAIGKRLSEVKMPPDTTVALVISMLYGAQVPRHDLTFGAGDQVIAVTKPSSENALRRVLTGS